nr:hypothetical protein [uncultured Butyrivibrio sp.]
MERKSILIKDTTREEREQIVKSSLDCGGGCENCSSCWFGGGSCMRFTMLKYREMTRLKYKVIA